MDEKISFILDNKLHTINFDETLKPTTTVLNYLRFNPLHKGVKEGCAEGDCGACTVVLAELNKENKITYKAVDSCLVFLPMIKNKQLITVENISQTTNSENCLHPVQQELLDANGSQCGFCSPGIVMSLFALYKSKKNPSKEIVEDSLTGNLCRCTGYKPIIESALKSCSTNFEDSFVKNESSIIEELLQLKNSNKTLTINTAEQKYSQPISLNEALELKNKFNDAILINGATDVALRVTKRHELLTSIIDLSQINQLKEFTETETELEFGSGLSLEDVKSISENKFYTLFETLTVFGSKQIREMATLGGNVGSCSPISDTIPLWLVCDAKIKLQSINDQRLVNIKDYIIGYRKTAKREDEIITSIVVPKFSNNSIKYYKVSKRKDLDISTVCAAFNLKLEGEKIAEIKIAFGGMAEITKRVIEAEEFLKGKIYNRENMEAVMKIIGNSFTPISDARSGAEFRKIVAQNLVLKFWSETKLN